MTEQIKNIYYRWIPLDAYLDKKLTLYDKHILMQLISYAIKSKVCFASNARLASDLNCSASTITRSISKLKEEGWIEVKMEYKKGTKYIARRLITFPEIIIKGYDSMRKKMTKKEINAKLPDPMWM